MILTSVTSMTDAWRRTGATSHAQWDKYHCRTNASLLSWIDLMIMLCCIHQLSRALKFGVASLSTAICARTMAAVSSPLNDKWRSGKKVRSLVAGPEVTGVMTKDCFLSILELLGLVGHDLCCERPDMQSKYAFANGSGW